MAELMESWEMKGKKVVQPEVQASGTYDPSSHLGDSPDVCLECKPPRVHPLQQSVGMLVGALTPKGEQDILNILSRHCGEHGQNEGAVETLERIIRERDLLLKRATEDMLKPAHY